ncbi:RteC domain-containing protein [Sphingobacterium siyangense]|jgi:hypothetical protein|uniref:RteC domain-containing protein n=1 Tax=Sphingobacterium siyangense TaxID=459529 RepID=UPI003C7735B3
MLSREIENLYSAMLKQLDEINGSLRDSIKNLGESLLLIKSTVTSLRQYIRNHPFINDQQEISFFKYTKPRFAAWQIYCVELNNIISSVPIGTDEMIKEYYENELSIIDRFFKVYAFYYQYYLKNEISNDQRFFLRRKASPFPPCSELMANDPDFSTELDHLFSLFKGNEMLRDFIIRRIKILTEESNKRFMVDVIAKRNRSWSGDKVELIEIAYGIYYTGRINNGRAEIADIVQWLEDSLDVDLSQAYRMFVDIRRRKTVSYTKYLDEMREAIHSHIEDSFKH